MTITLDKQGQIVLESLSLDDLPDIYKEGHTSCIANEINWRPNIPLDQLSVFLENKLARHMKIEGDEDRIRRGQRIDSEYAIEYEILGFNTLGEFMWHNTTCFKLNVVLESELIKLLNDNTLVQFSSKNYPSEILTDNNSYSLHYSETDLTRAYSKGYIMDIYPDNSSLMNEESKDKYRITFITSPEEKKGVIETIMRRYKLYDSKELAQAEIDKIKS